MTSIVDKITIPAGYDRRIKMTDEDIAEAKRLRKEDPEQWSYNKLARKYGVSKRLIIFRIKPETLEKVLERRRERGGYRTDTKKQTAYMRSHRQYKKNLIQEGVIKI